MNIRFRLRPHPLAKQIKARFADLLDALRPSPPTQKAPSATAAPKSAVDDPWQRAHQAHELLEAGRLDAAAREFQALVQEYPRLPAGHTGLAAHAQRLENWRLAARRWRECVRRFADQLQPWWLAQYAQALVRMESYAEARQVLQALPREHADFSVGHLELAALALRLQDWQAAVEGWRTCIRRFHDGSHAQWHKHLACALMGQEDYTQAIACYQEIERFGATDADCLVNLAKASFLTGRAQDCLAYAQRLSTEYPHLSEGHHWCKQALNGLQPATGAASQGAGEMPPGRQAEQAYDLLRKGRQNTAIRMFRELIQKHPQAPAGYTGLAAHAEQQKDWPRAVSLWRDCIQRFDQQVPAWWLVQYAKALIQLESLDEARDVLQGLIQTHPDLASGYVELAMLHHRMRDWAAAARGWQTCIRRFPDGGQIQWRKHHAYALTEQGEYAAAIGCYQIIEQAGEMDANCLQNLAKAHYLAEQPEACLGCARRLIETCPEMPEGYYWSEQALIKLGRFKEAADYYLARPDNQSRVQTSLEIPPNYPADLVLPEIPGNGNDYGFIQQGLDQFVAAGHTLHLPVSVVIPVYNRADILAKTLAALSHQTYPRELMEIVIADDGSSDHIAAVVAKYQRRMQLRYVRQEDLGYRVAAARNLGIAAASHRHLVLLDCDIMPEPGLIEAHMSYFHVTDQAVTLGIRQYVCADGYTDADLLADAQLLAQLPRILPADTISNIQTQAGQAVDWRIPVMARTRDLKDAKNPCSHLVGCNLAMPKSAFDAVGGFDEAFTDWGGEDTEFGFRLYNKGYYFIPITGVFGLHQEPSPGRGEQQTDRSLGRRRTQPLLEQKYPMLPSRRNARGGPYLVPKVSIYIPAYNVAEFIKEAVDSALQQSFSDLEVVVCNDGSSDDTQAVLERNFGGHPRVRLLQQGHQGIAAATNRAVNACRGMYIGQLDADDMLEPTAVAAMVQLLDRENIGMAYGRESRVDRHGRVMRLIPSKTFSRQQLMVSMICTPFRMFRKRDWSRTSGCDESLQNAVDYDLALKLSEVCHIAQLPELTYKYRFHGANTSLANRGLQERNHVIVINKALQRMGLSASWRAVAGPPTDRRRLSFERLDAAAQGAGSRPAASPRQPTIEGSWLLAGVARSGTTWLQEVMNFDRTQRILFEPFHAKRVELLAGWRCRQYLRPENESPDYLQVARAILSGNIRHAWVDAHSPVKDAPRRIVKDVRAQLILGWIKRHFPDLPMVMLLRHPCAVANSRCQLNWTPDLDVFLSQDALMEDFLGPFRQHIETLIDPFDQHVFSWCIENWIPLAQFSCGEILPVFYENLGQDPQPQLRGIFTYLGQDFSTEALAACTKPSALSREHSALLNGANPVDFWRTQLSGEKILRAREICRLFGVDVLYGEDALPGLDADQVLRLFSA